MNLTQEELRIIWEALSQFSENRCEDEQGEKLQHPVLDTLVERFDSHFIAQNN